MMAKQARVLSYMYQQCPSAHSANKCRIVFPRSPCSDLMHPLMLMAFSIARLDAAVQAGSLMSESQSCIGVDVQW